MNYELLDIFILVKKMVKILFLLYIITKSFLKVLNFMNIKSIEKALQ